MCRDPKTCSTLLLLVQVRRSQSLRISGKTPEERRRAKAARYAMENPIKKAQELGHNLAEKVRRKTGNTVDVTIEDSEESEISVDETGDNTGTPPQASRYYGYSGRTPPQHGTSGRTPQYSSHGGTSAQYQSPYAYHSPAPILHNPRAPPAARYRYPMDSN